jgi:hypothetical protein
MDFGKVEYIANVSGNGSGNRSDKTRKTLKLTLVGQGDEEILRQEGLAALRRKRIIRLTREAMKQGVLFTYDDLSGLLLTSLATLKRDVCWIEKQGKTVHLKGRRNGVNSNGQKKNEG